MHLPTSTEEAPSHDAGAWLIPKIPRLRPLALIDFNLTDQSTVTAQTNMVFGPVPNREYHEGFMRKAIEMAELALASDETPVGCVFVRNGEIIGRGINGTNASLNVWTSDHHYDDIFADAVLPGHSPRRVRRSG